MTTARMHFREIVQNVHDVGAAAEEMKSEIHFDLYVGEEVYPNLICLVKQAAGATFADHPIEVLLPDGYDGPIDYDAYRNCVERYYRSLVGGTGSAINLGQGVNVVMRNNRFIAEADCAFDIVDS